MPRNIGYIALALVAASCLPFIAKADNATVPTDTVYASSLCSGSKTALKSTYLVGSLETYLWRQTKQGTLVMNDTLTNTARSLIITANDTAEYVCDVVHSEVSAANNLMANGDFENNPPSNFTSDYQYAGWDQQQYYNNHAGASNLYCITHDASYFWKDFYAVLPHGGNYFALFDAGKSGYAWKAETRDNPRLILEKDSIYLFSYWAAYPNKGANNQPAQLQFVIAYKDPSGVTQTNNLGTVHILGTANPLNAWEYREVRWKAPCNATEVMIGVFDKNTSEGGNDFCLDDIMFQKTTTLVNTVIHRTVFIVQPHTCDPPCPSAKTLSVDTTLCANTVFPISWRGNEVTQFGSHQFVITTQQGCDSIIYNLDVRSKECDPCEGVVATQISIDTTVCDTTQFPLIWRGQTFAQAGSAQQLLKSQQGCDSVLYIYTLSLKECPVPCVGIEMYAKWKDVIFVPDPDLVYASYQWYHEGNIISGATEQFYYDPDGLIGLYHCIMHTHVGAIVEACPTDFSDLTHSAALNPGDTTVQQVAQQVYWISPHIYILVTTYSDQSVVAEKHLVQ